jgi:hypothetical protein
MAANDVSILALQEAMVHRAEGFPLLLHAGALIAD